jgi:hypothetical protein
MFKSRRISSLLARNNFSALPEFFAIVVEGYWSLTKPLARRSFNSLCCTPLLFATTLLVMFTNSSPCRIDHKTEVQLRAVIAEHFSQHTVIEVAHRLDSILDFDLVLLMDKGSIIESGQPRVLLERGQESAFGRLYNDLKSD